MTAVNAPSLDGMSAGRLRVGISSPWNLFDSNPEQRRSLLNDIADAGIDHLFMADHVSFRGGSGDDVMVHLAALSGIEPRLDLYAGVFLLALRHPMVAARQIASLAAVAPGGLVMGIGVGGEDRHEFEVCGVDPASRGARTDAALQIVRRVLDGETLDWDDEFFVLDAAKIRPTPPERVPFVIGGRSDAALVRAGLLGDGWLAAWTTADRFASGVARSHEVAEAAGRSPQWRHGYQIWVGVGSGPDDGRRHVAEAMERFYRMPFEPFARFTPCGTSETIAADLAPFVAAGAVDLNVTPCGATRAIELDAVAEIKRLLSTI